jgi:neurofibromin 1
VRAVSEKLAASEPHLTVEFLHESFVGYHKSTIALKNLCLEYMAPWLANMAKVARGATDDHIMTQKKLKEILQKLIELTVKDAEMYHAVQNKIWLALGRVDDIIPMLIDAFVTFSVDNGMSSQPSDIIANTIVTLHSVNVRGKIVARLRRVIQNTSLRPTRTLTDHASWGEICVLIRFAVMLSFNNRLRVQQYLPEIFHVISIIAATGPSIIRSSVHGIVINAVQSLCTTQELKESRSKQLTLLLSEFSEPKTRLLFGLTRASSNAFTRTAESIADNPESMPLSSLETIVHMMLDAMALGAPDVEASNAWRARWMSLVTSTAFQFNPAIQPRAFVVLGCLARDEVDDDLLYQILVALKGALSLFDDGDCSLIVSIVMCLTSIAENLTKDSPYLRQMFWLAMVLVQIGHVPLFPSALNLLEVVLRNLESHGCFAEETPAEFLMKRRIPIKDTPINIYQSFEVNFSFAVSTVLLKGLKHPLTVTATSSALTTLLEITCKSRAIDGKVNPDVLGYLTPLLPQAAKNSELHELLWLVGINTNDDAAKEGGDAIYRHIFERLTIPDDNTAMLLISMMVTMLSNAEFEAEQLFLYGFLAEAAKLLPDVFNIFYESLLTKMNQVLGSSQSVDIIEAVQSILYTMVSSPATRIRRQQRPPLSEIGFGSLPECGSFHSVSRAQKKAFADLASKSVELMVG